MGTGRYNVMLQCDYATPDKHSAVELHMELPVPHSDLSKVQSWFEAGEWARAESYLIGLYPEHRAMISDWSAASKQRSEGRSSLPTQLVAVG